MGTPSGECHPSTDWEDDEEEEEQEEDPYTVHNFERFKPRIAMRSWCSGVVGLDL